MNASITYDPLFIGRDDDLCMLVDQIHIQIPQERKFSILTIVGKDGVGKTTLTRNVFNHENLKAQFGSRIWVHVSRIFDPLVVFKSIISALTSETTDGTETEKSILRELRQALKAKTFLLVLDDVWTHDATKWEKFINSISGSTSTKGNVIIITTRDLEVVSLVKPLRNHLLNVLSDEDRWSIIKENSFGKGDVPSRFEIIGTKIAKICQGLPLTTNIVGGMLRGQDWMSVEKKWFPDVERYFMLDFLEFNLDSLSSPIMKKCVSYCSIFPKGHKIVRQELVELWMAEGFLQHYQRNDMESLGTIYSMFFYTTLYW